MVKSSNFMFDGSMIQQTPRYDFRTGSGLDLIFCVTREEEIILKARKISISVIQAIMQSVTLDSILLRYQEIILKVLNDPERNAKTVS